MSFCWCCILLPELQDCLSCLSCTVCVNKIWLTLLPRMADTALARSSDDFWPRDTASHTTHIAVNAGNAMFLAALVQPDWDMFHSKHPAALLHATARVVRPLHYMSSEPE